MLSKRTSRLEIVGAIHEDFTACDQMTAQTPRPAQVPQTLANRPRIEGGDPTHGNSLQRESHRELQVLVLKFSGKRQGQ